MGGFTFEITTGDKFADIELQNALNAIEGVEATEDVYKAMTGKDLIGLTVKCSTAVIISGLAALTFNFAVNHGMDTIKIGGEATVTDQYHIGVAIEAQKNRCNPPEKSGNPEKHPG